METIIRDRGAQEAPDPRAAWPEEQRDGVTQPTPAPAPPAQQAAAGPPQTGAAPAAGAAQGATAGAGYAPSRGAPLGGTATPGGYAPPSAIEDAVYSGTARALREHGLRQADRATVATPTPTGELRIEHEPAYQPGDTVRPVEGARQGIVIPPGTRSVEPETPSSVITPGSPDFRPPSSTDLPR